MAPVAWCSIMIFGVCILMAGSHGTTPPKVCGMDSECYGGICNLQTGECTCPPLWSGANCETLDLKPAQTSSGLRFNTSSTWGGNAIYDNQDGNWHMYAAFFVDNCGLKTWTHTSEIIHATSPFPAGPYKLVHDNSTVLLPFAHNPTTVKVTESTYVLAHIGCGEGGPSPVTGCTNGTTCNNSQCWVPAPVPPPTHRVSLLVPSPTDPHRNNRRNNQQQQQQQKSNNHSRSSSSNKKNSCDTPHFTGLLSASSLSGPWSSVGPSNETLVVDGGNKSWHSPYVTNPSFYSFDNGSVLLAYSTGCTACKISAGHKHIGLAFGETWRGPFTDLTITEPIFPWASEDPCVWYDSTNTLSSFKFHILSHTDWSGVAEEGHWVHVSAHAIAEHPQGPWVVVPSPPYTREITWEMDNLNNETLTSHVETRERPQIFYDEHGTPVALSNGVMPGNHSTPWNERGFTGDWTYTHIQMLHNSRSEQGMKFNTN